MEVTTIQGKKDNSQHFFIAEINEIFVKKSKKPNVEFVTCYHSKDGCQARGKIDSLGFHTSDTSVLHSNHQYRTSSVFNYLACFNEMKHFARTSGKLPNVIYDEVMLKYEGTFDIPLTFPSVQSTLLKCRRQYFPKFPQSVDEFFSAFEQESVRERYGHCLGKLFFHGQFGNELDGRCAIFYTSQLLQHFDAIKHEIKAFADGTFKYQPTYFHQLFIVHFEIGKYTFPAFYVFMERKTTEAYQCVFEVISNLGFNIIELMADFEPAIKNAFLAIFPAGTVYGCHFHLAQALLRKMRKSKSMKVDLNLLRILSSLAFLPAEHIVPTFLKIKAKYCKPNNSKFFKYFYDFWIKKVGPAGFSIFGRDQITNNVAESFHSLIKNFIGVLSNASSNSKLWELLDQLIKVHHRMEIQINIYAETQFMGTIRMKSKKRSIINKNRLNALYSRMKDSSVDFDGLHFVESIHDNKFVEYVETLENERQNREILENDSSEEDSSSEDETDSEQICVVCKTNRRSFIYNKCSHLVLCSDCAEKLIEANNFRCVFCRFINTKIKRVFT